jgi:hypothetical protein
MKNSSLSITIVSEEMSEFHLSLDGGKGWPNIARYDSRTHTLRFFDAQGTVIHELAYSGPLENILPNFGLAFIGVTESTVDFQTKSQFIAAKMRAVNLDSHEALHGDNWGYDE